MSQSLWTTEVLSEGSWEALISIFLVLKFGKYIEYMIRLLITTNLTDISSWALMMIELEIDNEIVVSDSIRQSLKVSESQLEYDPMEFRIPSIRYTEKFVKQPWEMKSKAISVSLVSNSKELVDYKSLKPILSKYFADLSVDKAFQRTAALLSSDFFESKKSSSTTGGNPHIKSRYPHYIDFESRISREEKKRWLLFHLSTHKSDDLYKYYRYLQPINMK